MNQGTLFPVYTRNEKQESEKTGYPAENTSEILVPAISGKSGEFSESREQEYRRVGSQVSPLSPTRINRMDAGATSENDMTARRMEVY